MSDTALKHCPFCGKHIVRRIGYGGILFFDCWSCGACVSFKNIRNPMKMQADDPIACFNRREVGGGA